MKAKKITIEFDDKESLEIVLTDSEILELSQTNGISEVYDEETNSVKKIPTGKRYITINISPLD